MTGMLRIHEPPPPRGSPHNRSTASPGRRRPEKDVFRSAERAKASRPAGMAIENFSTSNGSSTSLQKTGSPSAISILARAPNRSSNSFAGMFRRPVPDSGTDFFARFWSENDPPAGIASFATTISTGADLLWMSAARLSILCLARSPADAVRTSPTRSGAADRSLFFHSPEEEELSSLFFQNNNLRLLSPCEAPDE